MSEENVSPPPSPELIAALLQSEGVREAMRVTLKDNGVPIIGRVFR